MAESQKGMHKKLKMVALLGSLTAPPPFMLYQQLSRILFHKSYGWCLSISAKVQQNNVILVCS
jgi:hypothetical protein